MAIEAIKVVGLDHYLMKPWSPPEEPLNPVLDDVLEEGSEPTASASRACASWGLVVAADLETE